MPSSHIILWAFPIGALVAFLLIFALLLWQRWGLRRRRERPPIETNLLRPPGHTLSIWLQAKEDPY